MKLFKKSFTISFCSRHVCIATGRNLQQIQSFLLCAGQKMREPNGNFYCNPLMLEGVPFNDNVFTLKSKGVELLKATKER